MYLRLLIVDFSLTIFFLPTVSASMNLDFKMLLKPTAMDKDYVKWQVNRPITMFTQNDEHL